MPEPTPSLSFDAVLRREHFADFNAQTLKRLARANAGWVSALLFTTPVFVLSLVFAEWARSVSLPRDPRAGFGPVEVVILALVTGVLLSLFLAWLLARRQMKAYKEGILREGGSYLGPRRFTLDQDGITTEGAHGRAMTRWSAVLEMTEAAETYLIWTDPGAAVMVPRDAFPDAPTRAAFESFVTRLTAGNPRQ